MVPSAGHKASQGRSSELKRRNIALGAENEVLPVPTSAMNDLPIENYGVIGDLNTVALVSREGSIDFMCFPRFDSPSIFAALLNGEKGGYFQIAPAAGDFKRIQRYLPDTNILLT